jgi:6-phosphogluconolactonase (cycloisomerase 2 family)
MKFPAGVFAYKIDSGGALSQVAGSPFPGGTGSPVADPSCRFLFVPNSGTINAYLVDGASGKLSLVSGSPFTVPNSTGLIRSAATDTTGSFLYVPDHDSKAIFGFSIGPTGALVPLSGPPFTAGRDPNFALALSLSSKHYLYIANGDSNDISAFAVDQKTGELNLISNYASNSQPSFLASSGSFLFSFNLATGNLASESNVSVYSVNQDGTLVPLATAGNLGYSPTSATVVTAPD